MDVRQRTNDVRGQAVTRPPSRERPRSARGYRAAALVAVVGLVAGAAWGLVAYMGFQSDVDNFARFEAPGSVTLAVSRSGGRVVYREGPGPTSLSEIGLTVTAPDSTDVPVLPYEADLRYDAPDHRVGRAVATFDASMPGHYEVRADGTPADGVRFAVGGSIPASTVAGVVGGIVVIVLGLVAAGVVAFATAVRRSTT